MTRLVVIATDVAGVLSRLIGENDILQVAPPTADLSSENHLALLLFVRLGELDVHRWDDADTCIAVRAIVSSIQAMAQEWSPFACEHGAAYDQVCKLAARFSNCHAPGQSGTMSDLVYNYARQSIDNAVDIETERARLLTEAWAARPVGAVARDFLERL